MPEANEDEAGDVFNPMRPRLTRTAYRMLGSVADAEDVVQEAFMRWLGTDRSAVREPAAFLHRIVTRLCLDQLKSARRKRETYIGPWLPEPFVTPLEDELSEVDDITLPLMMALERLSPLERAAFLLHDLLGESFEVVGQTIGREPAACRQLASRARSHVHAARPRFPVAKEQGLAIAERFFAATREGDMDGLMTLLSVDVSIHADGGGKASSATKPVFGRHAVMRLHAFLATVFDRSMSKMIRFAWINGLPGFITLEAGDLVQTTALQIEDGMVRKIYVIRNPDKLRHLSEAGLA